MWTTALVYLAVQCSIVDNTFLNYLSLRDVIESKIKNQIRKTVLSMLKKMRTNNNPTWALTVDKMIYVIFCGWQLVIHSVVICSPLSWHKYKISMYLPLHVGCKELYSLNKPYSDGNKWSFFNKFLVFLQVRSTQFLFFYMREEKIHTNTTARSFANLLVLLNPVRFANVI